MCCNCRRNAADTGLYQHMGGPDAGFFKCRTAFLGNDCIAFHHQRRTLDVALPGAIGQQQPTVLFRRRFGGRNGILIDAFCADDPRTQCLNPCGKSLGHHGGQIDNGMGTEYPRACGNGKTMIAGACRDKRHAVGCRFRSLAGQIFRAGCIADHLCNSECATQRLEAAQPHAA